MQQEKKMANLKHVGRLKANQRKVVVACRVLPNDPNNCLIVDTASLTDADHDVLMSTVESPKGQEAYEFIEAMGRTRLQDGSVMLASFHKNGRLVKVPTTAVEMTPNTTTAVLLSEVNEAVATQKGVSVADLAMSDGGEGETIAKVNEVPKGQVEKEMEADMAAATAPAEDGVLSDEQLAASYRSQADALFKEAKALREQAEELVPTKRKKKTTEA
jgi:hypothetical protein